MALLSLFCKNIQLSADSVLSLVCLACTASTKFNPYFAIIFVALSIELALLKSQCSKFRISSHLSVCAAYTDSAYM
jgi:hypothetical protein